MYWADEENMTLTKTTTKKWLLRTWMTGLPIAPILRHCDAIKYAVVAWAAQKYKDYENQRKYYELMVKEKSDAALLGLFETFLEAAPQQVLQQYIWLTRIKAVSTFTYYCQWASFVKSVLCMGLSMALYQKAVRLARQHKENLTGMATFVQFLWHSNVIVSRLLSISVAAVMFPELTVVVGVIHWFVMMSWLSLWEWLNFCYSQKFSVVKQEALEILFCSILGLVYIFAYVAPKDGQNRTRYTIYYTICCVENILAMVAWTTADREMWNKWYFYPYLIWCFVPFVIGIGFMLLYYLCFHPVMQKGKCCNKSSDRKDMDLQSSSRSNVERNSVTHKPSESARVANDNTLIMKIKSHKKSQRQTDDVTMENCASDTTSVADSEPHQHCDESTV